MIREKDEATEETNEDQEMEEVKETQEEKVNKEEVSNNPKIKAFKQLCDVVKNMLSSENQITKHITIYKD